MKKRTLSRKQIVTALLAFVVIISVMLTLHILVNNFDLFSFARSLHGG
jgi:hypothetical protein